MTEHLSVGRSRSRSRRRSAIAVGAAGILAGTAACGAAPAGRVPAAAGQCGRATAPAPLLRPPRPIQVVGSLPSQPYAVAVTRHWAFVSYPRGFRLGFGLISVLAIRGPAVRLVRTVPVPGEPMGLALAGGGRLLLAANYVGGLEALSAQALERGHGRVVLARLPSRGSGPDEVAVARGGRYAFVPEERPADVAVFDLGGLLAGGGAVRGPGRARETGLIPVAAAPAGVALAPSGSPLYVISQGDGRPGRLSAISVSAAEQHPGRAVIGSIPAGCDPVRIALSGAGAIAWVTDRGGNAVSAFRLSPGRGAAVGRLAAVVRVGSEPVGVTVIDSGRLVLVTDSARYSAPSTPQTIAVIAAARALAHRRGLLGYLTAGAFPRQFGRSAGGPLLFTDFDSQDVRVIGTADLAWLGQRDRRAGTGRA